MSIGQRIEKLEEKMQMNSQDGFGRLIVDYVDSETDGTLRHSACNPNGDCKAYLKGVKEAQKRGERSCFILIICDEKCEFRAECTDTGGSTDEHSKQN